MMEGKQELGKFGELIASQYLIERGYTIRQKNVRILRSEIDLIASKEGVLVFVEVKTRKTERFGGGLESVDFRKQKKIIQAANLYLSGNKMGEVDSFRFDVIAISVDPRSNVPTRILHCQDAFRA